MENTKMQSGALATVQHKELITIMQEPVFHVNYGHQLTLDASEVVEISLRVGIIPSADHVQFQFAVTDCLTGELIELRSRPHVTLEQTMAELSDWIQALQEEVWDMVGPF